MNGEIARTPFAVGSDGTVYANIAHLQGDLAVTKLLQYARWMDGVLFIGIAITQQEKKGLLLTLDNAGAEAVAKTLPPSGRIHGLLTIIRPAWLGR